MASWYGSASGIEFADLRKIIAEYLCLDEEENEITPESELDVLGLEPADLLEITMNAEDALDVSIAGTSDALFSADSCGEFGLRTAQDFLDFINANIGP